MYAGLTSAYLSPFSSAKARSRTPSAGSVRGSWMKQPSSSAPAATPGASFLLRRCPTKSLRSGKSGLMDRSRRLFLDKGGVALPAIQEIDRRLAALRSAMRDDFPRPARHPTRQDNGCGMTQGPRLNILRCDRVRALFRSESHTSQRARQLQELVVARVPLPAGNPADHTAEEGPLLAIFDKRRGDLFRR